MISDESIAKRYPLAWVRQTDYFSRVDPLLENGRWAINTDGKIAMTSSGIDSDTPWIRVRTNSRRKCRRHWEVLFQCFNVVPRFCFDCFKIVVRPRTVVELFKLLETLRGLPEIVTSKCGIEVREYVPALYGGYVYALGAEEGHSLHSLVAEAVADEIAPEVPVSLKRACTEFEIEHGPPDRWRYRPAWKLCEQWVDEHFVFHEGRTATPSFLHARTMQKWIEHAHAAGEMSYLLLSGGEPLHPLSHSYDKRIKDR